MRMFGFLGFGCTRVIRTLCCLPVVRCIWKALVGCCDADVRRLAVLGVFCLSIGWVCCISGKGSFSSCIASDHCNRPLLLYPFFVLGSEAKRSITMYGSVQLHLIADLVSCGSKDE